MKPKLYISSNAKPPIHESISGFENSIPMCKVGIENNFIVTTDSSQADYFWAGQVKDTEAWLLHPNRYEFFEGNESRYIFELEGDWRDRDHPDWLRDAIVVTGHARLESESKFTRRFVRPVVSPLLLRLVRDLRQYTPPEQHGFWFQGQRDSRGLRQKVWRALELAGVPHEFVFTPEWGVYLDEQHALARSYFAKAAHWSMALCPIGEGPSCRFYEMALFHRLLVLIGDYRVFAEDVLGDGMRRLATGYTDAELGVLLAEMHRDMAKPNTVDAVAGVIRYANELRTYFNDPTAYLLRWLGEQ